MRGTKVKALRKALNRAEIRMTSGGWRHLKRDPWAQALVSGDLTATNNAVRERTNADLKVRALHAQSASTPLALRARQIAAGRMAP